MSKPNIYSALLSPHSVAIVGASENLAKTTARPLQYLLDADWPGTIMPVNPHRAEVQGVPAWPSVSALPVTPDHVLICTDSDLALGALEECVKQNVPLVTIMADGFAPSTFEGVERRNAMLDLVKGSETRVMGPSSLGVVNVAKGLPLTANATFSQVHLKAGGLFIASQSGSVVGALASRGAEMGIGFHALVSTGNELDLSLGSICAMAVDDPAVTGFALFLENIANAEDLRAFALAADAAGKPVVAYKLGRTEAAAQLSVGHSGALAGDDSVVDAFLADLGIARVKNFSALLEAVPLAARSRGVKPGRNGPTVGVVSTTGGGGAMMIDCLASSGVNIASPSADTAARLLDKGLIANDGALVDLTLAGTRAEVMKAALETMLEGEEFDAVVVVPGSSAQFHPELTVEPIIEVAEQSDKPLVAFVMPSAPYALKLLRSRDVAGFTTPESCADAVRAVLGRREPVPRERVRTVTGSVPVTLDESQSSEILESLGVPMSSATALTLPLPETPLSFDFPVVVKALSSALAHKSDVGGVVANIGSEQELRAAIAAIVSAVGSARPDVHLESVLVQPMQFGIAEVLISYRHEADAGPMVIVAAGGLLAEVNKDRSVRAAPVSVETAEQMISEVRALYLAAGYRGSERGDLKTLAATIVALSHASEWSEATILEAEVNPVIVRSENEGVVAVDAVVVIDGRSVGKAELWEPETKAVAR